MTEHLNDSANESNRRNRWQLLFILLTPIVVMIGATGLYFGGLLTPTGQSNHGVLLNPVLSVTDLGLPEPIINETRNWQLIQFAPECADACLEKSYEQRQMHIALGKLSPRIQRVLITESTLPEQFKRNFPHLTVSHYQVNGISEAILQRVPSAVLEDNPVFVADPFGNIMLYFTRDHDYRAQMSDLKKLLKLSTIG